MMALLVSTLIAICVSVLICEGERKARAWQLGTYAIPVIAIVAIVSLMTSVGGASSTIDLLGKRVFDVTVINRWSQQDFPLSLPFWINMGNVLGVTGAVSISICVCLIAPEAPPQPVAGEEPVVFRKRVERAADELEARTKKLKYLLFAASIVLISGIASMQAWRGWPSGVLKLETPDAAKSYDALAKVTTQFHAFLFVLILIAIFLPMAIWLQRNAYLLFETAKAGGAVLPTQTSAMWRQQQGLTLSLSENIQRITAVIAPILVGPLLDLAKTGLNVTGTGG